MFCFGVLKRVVPFVLTFAAGLFIASFFVSVAMPRFPVSHNHGGARYHKWRAMTMEMDRVNRENERLQAEVERLTEELNFEKNVIHGHGWGSGTGDFESGSAHAEIR